MNIGEKEVKAVAKLYECRDAAKMLFKEEYKSKLEPFIHIVKQTMKANKVDVIPSLLIISKTRTYQESGMAQMLFMAAIVEIIEPSNT